MEQIVLRALDEGAQLLQQLRLADGRSNLQKIHTGSSQAAVVGVGPHQVLDILYRLEQIGRRRDLVGVKADEVHRKIIEFAF